MNVKVGNDYLILFQAREAAGSSWLLDYLILMTYSNYSLGMRNNEDNAFAKER